MTLSNSDRDPLEELAAEFTERCRRGERPAVDEYVSRHPELAADIRELFATIQQVEEIKEESTAWSGSSSAALTPAPARIGDFRILRELGRGGMGIVYLAEQESLARRVAIKVLPQHWLFDARRRERFEREARTVAKLHHTNIIPVFGVGQQDGHAYYVMQYIHGVGLDSLFQKLYADSVAPAAGVTSGSSLEAFDFSRAAMGLLQPPPGETGGAQRPLTGRYWRSLAALMAQAADALAYAHSQGIVHRDIKPSNLLLDGDGILWIADFGLAKVVEQADITHAGDVVGTLRYMAPEQYAGQGEPRSDVYSLGITLYELAILRPAFTGKQGISAAQAILQEPLWPAKRLCPRLPRDLDTIIATATAREPRHRYASAAELRDDLLRFVEDRPVAVRRVSARERLWRWSRRNPAIAVSAGLALALLVATVAVTCVAYLKVQRAHVQTREALVAEQGQRQRVEATANLAVEALDAMFNQFTPTTAGGAQEVSLESSTENTLVVSVPAVLSPETASFLQGMLRYYRAIAEQGSESSALLLKMAVAQRHVGEIYNLLGQYSEAQAAFESSLSQYEKLRQVESGNIDLFAASAQVHIDLGLIFIAQDAGSRAQAEFEAARGLVESRVEQGQSSDKLRFALARACYLLARPISADTLVLRAQRSRPGPGGFDRPPPPDGDFRPPPDRDFQPPPRDREFEPPPPGGPPPEGPPPEDIDAGAGPPRRAASAYLEQAVEILTQLSQEHPDTAEYRYLLAQCLREPRGPGSARGSERTGPMARSIAILEDLTRDFPHVPQYQFELGQTYVMQPPTPEAVDQMERALVLFQQLTDRWPHVPSYQFALTYAHLRLAHAYRQDGDEQGGMDHLRQAVDLQASLTRQFPGVPSYAVTAAVYESLLAGWLEDRTELEPALQLLESATQRMDQLLAAEGDKTRVRDLAARCYRQLADLYRAVGDDEMAERAQAAWEPLLPPPPPE